MTDRNATSLTEADDTAAVSGEALARLKTATEELRRRVSPRSVEIANGVFSAAVGSFRRTHPVRAFPPNDFAYVGDRVLIDRLRREIDDRSPTYAVGRIELRTAGDDSLSHLTVELFVQYGVVITDAADQVREVSADVIAGLLGAPVEVEVFLTHVHVGDVTVGNPHLMDPADERI